MKIVTITLGKNGQRAEREGWIIISYADPRGGRTSIGTMVKRPSWTADHGNGPQTEHGPLPKWDQIAVSLDEQMRANQAWPRFILSKASGNVVRMSVPDDLDPVVFFGEFNPDLDQRAPHELHPDFIVIAEEKF